MTSTLNDQILELVKKTADRMRDPNDVGKILLQSQCIQADFLYPRSLKKWPDISLGRGFSGILILMSELDHLFPNEKWDQAAHLYVLRIKKSIENEGIHSIAMYSGITGVCFAIRQASQDGTRYQKIVKKLDQYLLDGIQEQYIIPFQENLKKRQPSPINLYDTISGLSGIGIYVLTTLPDSPLQPIVREILRTLVTFTQPIEIEEKQIPGWYIPPEYLFHDYERKKNPKGNFNLGLSHGVTGVLAFLSIAFIRGAVVDGQRESIQRVADWIVNHRVLHRAAFSWKTAIAFEEEIDTNIRETSISRDAWCYGAPGIAAALLLAGKALQNEKMQKFAINSLCSVFSRTQEEWVLSGPTFCHGISGLLFIIAMIGKEQDLSELTIHIEQLTEILLGFYRAEYPFGFRHYEQLKNGGYTEVDNVGLLEGASGILLTLLSIHSATSWWDAPFLIRNGKK